MIKTLRVFSDGLEDIVCRAPLHAERRHACSNVAIVVRNSIDFFHSVDDSSVEQVIQYQKASQATENATSL